MKALYEHYRPASWEDLAGQDKCRQRVDVLRRRGLAGRVFWITGDSGTGKTTVLAEIIRRARQMGAELTVVGRHGQGPCVISSSGPPQCG